MDLAPGTRIMRTGSYRVRIHVPGSGVPCWMDEPDDQAVISGTGRPTPRRRSRASTCRATGTSHQISDKLVSVSQVRDLADVRDRSRSLISRIRSVLAGGSSRCAAGAYRGTFHVTGDSLSFMKWPSHHPRGPGTGAISLSTRAARPGPHLSNGPRAVQTPDGGEEYCEGGSPSAPTRGAGSTCVPIAWTTSGWPTPGATTAGRIATRLFDITVVASRAARLVPSRFQARPTT
jgi:hypothetical protein